jgi:glucosamine kinase
MSSYRIIADSGSTKTDWVLVDEDGGEVERLRTIGFNPYFHSSEFIFNEVKRSFDKSQVKVDDIVEVNFYGAGCSSKEKNQIVQEALVSFFLSAVIRVEHDLVAAARATLGNESGIAAIIGTGSNSGVWDNGDIIENVPSHGYIFGDEGSGSYLGIRLVKLFLEDKLDSDVLRDFTKQFKLTKSQILNASYKEKDPNVFLAHFATFYKPHIDYQPLKDIVERGFVEFFEKRVVVYKDYQKYKLGFVGSIAFYHREILSEVAARYGLEINRICRCPIEELVKYHQQNTALNPI